MKNLPVHKSPYMAVFLIEPTLFSREIFEANLEERENASKVSMMLTMGRRDTWADRRTAATHLRRRIPWKSWDPRVFDIFIASSAHDML